MLQLYAYSNLNKNSATSQNFLDESTINEADSTQYNSAQSENILNELAMNETEFTLCENMITEKTCSITKVLEPKIKLQKVSERDIVKARNCQVLKSIENFDIKCKFFRTIYIYIYLTSI